MDAVAIQFVGPSGQCQTRLEKSALSLFKEEGDLALRPTVLYNELCRRAVVFGEETIFEGKPIQEQYAAVERLINSFDAKDKMERRVQKIYETAIERCTQASDIANVRGHAQSGAHSALEAEAEELEAATAARHTGQHEPGPLFSGAGVFDRHDHKESNTLNGVSELADALLAGPAEGGESADAPGVTESGERKDQRLVLRRDDVALDDYESATEVLYSSCWYAPRPATALHRSPFSSCVCPLAFRDLFPLRRGLTMGRSVSPRQLRRMFTYLDNRFAQCFTLVFHCANVGLRQAANQAVSLRVKSQPGAFENLKSILEAPDFRSKLLHARQNPNGTEAQRILNQVVKFINAAAVKVPWGARERSAEVHALIAGQRAHGAAAIFYTCDITHPHRTPPEPNGTPPPEPHWTPLEPDGTPCGCCGRCAPDDVKQPLAVRLSFPHQGPEERHDDNGGEQHCHLFPRGQQGEFLAALRGQTTEERTAFEPHMDETSLQKLAAANPVASVLAFAHLAESYRTDLLGYSSDRPSNLSMPMPSLGHDGVEQERKRGVFGICSLNRDVKECNKRAAMHEHGQAHGVSPSSPPRVPFVGPHHLESPSSPPRVPLRPLGCLLQVVCRPRCSPTSRPTTLCGKPLSKR